MEQEEEWEREGLLDPAWEKQQKKVSSKQQMIPAPTNQYQIGNVIFRTNLSYHVNTYFDHVCL